MIPLRSDVNKLVRSLLGDTAVAAGTIYVDTFIPPFLNLAYQELFSRLTAISAFRVQKYGHYVLPAYTTVFVPSLAGLTNFGSPSVIWERGSATAYAISGATVATPSAGLCRLVVATLPAAIITGATVEIYGVGGISDDINDEWALTVNSVTSVDLNGCAAVGTFSGSSGKLVYSTEQWSQELSPVDNDTLFGRDAQASLSVYSWRGGAVRFPKCSTAREIRILFELSSSLPVSTAADADSMGVDDCLAFLGSRTAQYCAGGKGNRTKRDDMQAAADRSLKLMLDNQINQMQMGEPTVPAQFRSRVPGDAGWM